MWVFTPIAPPPHSPAATHLKHFLPKSQNVEFIWLGQIFAAVVKSGPPTMKAKVGLGTLSEDGLDRDDRYAVHLWPGKTEGIHVRKQWEDG